MRKDRADTAGIDITAVDVAAEQRERGTYVKTCAAADAVVYLAEALVRKDLAPSGIVEDHAVELLRSLLIRLFIKRHFRSAGIQGQIRCQSLRRAVAGKRLEDIARIGKGVDKLLDAEYI